MAINFKISDHAVKRFAERFGYNNSIELLLKNSIPFGGQKGSEYLLLNKDHDIVFPIVCGEKEKEHTVKTVLTIQQARANLSLSHRIEFESNISEKVEEIRKKAEEQRNKEKKARSELQANLHDPRITEENAKKLKALARDFVTKRGCFPCITERKQLFKEIKEMLPAAKGFRDGGYQRFNEILLGEIGRIIREENKCQT